MDPLKHWKTSLLGITAAVLQLLAHGCNPTQAIGAAAIAALGLAAQDSGTPDEPTKPNVN
jgi:hypothetical protein